MERETIDSILNYVEEYGLTKHNRKRREILDNIENLLCEDKPKKKGRTGKYGNSKKSNESSSNIEGAQTTIEAYSRYDGNGRSEEGSEKP